MTFKARTPSCFDFQSLQPWPVSTLFDFVRLSWLGKLDSAAPPLTSGPVPVPCPAVPCRALPCPCPEYLACLFCMDCITLQTSSLKNTAYLDGTTLAFSLPNEKEFSYYMLLLISTNSSKKSSKIKHIYIYMFQSLRVYVLILYVVINITHSKPPCSLFGPAWSRNWGNWGDRGGHQSLNPGCSGDGKAAMQCSNFDRHNFSKQMKVVLKPWPWKWHEVSWCFMTVKNVSVGFRFGFSGAW